MADDTNTAEREALGFFLEKRGDVWFVQFKEGGCRPATIPEKALWDAYQAGRASLAASAGSEPVALEPRHIRKFLQALQAGEMSVARAVEILDAWLEGLYSDDMVPPPPADSCLIADDEFPMEIVRKLRSEMATHPSPPEGAGWMPIETARASEWDQKNWAIVYCVPGDYQPASKKPVQLVAYYCKSVLGGKPYWSTEHGVIDECVHRPTHFRPQPAPPASEAKEL